MEHQLSRRNYRTNTALTPQYWSILTNGEFCLELSVIEPNDTNRNKPIYTRMSIRKKSSPVCLICLSKASSLYHILHSFLHRGLTLKNAVGKQKGRFELSIDKNTQFRIFFTYWNCQSNLNISPHSTILRGYIKSKQTPKTFRN